MTNSILTTSLAEIHSFNPCARGWKNILAARKPVSDADYNIQFPLVGCLESNPIADVCWLIGKRKKEIQICVRFARMCADSVKHLSSSLSDAAYAAYADAATAYATATAYAIVNAAASAATYATIAADTDTAAYQKQKELNKQFLIQCINEYQSEQA